MGNPVPIITLNNGVEIPQLGFGVWQVSADDIVDSVATALRVGYRHIDTAAIYRNEEGVGRAIKESGIDRDELFVTTKLWNSQQGRDTVGPALDESLAKLGLDHVDLYLIHWPAPGRDRYVDAWLAMEEQLAAGKTRAIGLSNFQSAHLARVLEAGSVVPAVNQVEIHPTFTQEPLVAETRAHGIAIEAWSPLGQAQDLDKAVVTGIAARLDRTPAQVILRWHLQKGYIVFPKSVTPSRIEENFDVFGFELSGDDVAAIDGLDYGNRIGGDPDVFGA
jgi:2,5-diketo-D-gluconate reductase A